MNVEIRNVSTGETRGLDRECLPTARVQEKCTYTIVHVENGFLCPEFQLRLEAPGPKSVLALTVNIAHVAQWRGADISQTRMPLQTKVRLVLPGHNSRVIGLAGRAISVADS